MNSEVSFVITSCGRFDLLAETISSFFAHNRAPIAKYVLVEDSGDESVRQALGEHESQFTILVNTPNIGQLKSIDRAYATVETPFIFHCEDDWRFFRGGFIEQSLRLLNNFPNVSNVLARRTGQNREHDRIIAHSGISQWGDVSFRLMNTQIRPPWGGYSFNPGLIRVADYKVLGPFAPFQHESVVSQEYARRGMAIASLEEPAYETTGRKRHVDDPYVPGEFKPKPKKPRPAFIEAIARLFSAKR